MKKININWSRIASTVVSAAQSSAAPIFTGLGMMGLALLCKKLDIPYNVLLDPGYTMNNAKITRFHQGENLPVAIMPSNSTEAAIGAIYDGAINLSSDYYRCDAAKKIFEILRKSPDDRTKSYAIMTLNNIAKACNSSYYSNEIMNMIARIGLNNG